MKKLVLFLFIISLSTFIWGQITPQGKQLKNLQNVKQLKIFQNDKIKSIHHYNLDGQLVFTISYSYDVNMYGYDYLVDKTEVKAYYYNEDGTKNKEIKGNSYAGFYTLFYKNESPTLEKAYAVYPNYGQRIPKEKRNSFAEVHDMKSVKDLESHPTIVKQESRDGLFHYQSRVKDEKGRTTRYFKYKSDGTAKRDFEYKYDENGNKIYEYHISDLAHMELLYEYDKNNNLKKKTHINYNLINRRESDERRKEEMSIRKYIYDENNLLIEEQHIPQSKIVEKYAKKIKYFYDNDGLIIQKSEFSLDETINKNDVYYDYKDGLLYTKTKIDYAYRDKLSKKEQENYTPRVTTYEYDFHD